MVSLVLEREHLVLETSAVTDSIVTAPFEQIC